ncbi:MAG: hypothetical protein ACOVO1_04660 [Chitinophagaceae bacterium]
MEEKKKSAAYLKKVARSKWSLALRRYLIENVPNVNYAPYFGLDTTTFRKWIEIQFTNDLSWDNYAKSWQFDHIVPVVYFDLEVEEDLRMCWSYINIRVEPFNFNKNRGNRVDVLAVKSYFLDLYNKTSFSLCKKMLDKIESIEVSSIESNTTIEQFINDNKSRLENIASLNKYEFNRFNAGANIEDIILEREILKKFGS